MRRACTSRTAYNYDVERAKRCVILYSTPAGVFPFCTYNCGPSYRRFVERSFAESSRPAAAPRPVEIAQVRPLETRP